MRIARPNRAGMDEKLTGTPGGEEALKFLADTYRTRLVRAGRTTEHPIAVARLLAADEQQPQLVIIGLLHDVLEDTGVTSDELRKAFGGEVARLVVALTQDDSISDYTKRKAELRGRILDAGPEASTVSLADKLAKLEGVDSRPRARKLDHYEKTLDEVERRYGPSRLSLLLRGQLDRWSGGRSD